MKNIIKALLIMIFMFNGLFKVVAQNTEFRVAKKTITTSTDIKLMTTKQFFEPYDLVFKAMMSLMHSEEYLITETNYDTGLILVSKETYKGAKAFFNTGFILVDNLNEELTEVKLSMYDGKSKTGAYGGIRRKENMNIDPEFYNNWFNNLYLEIQRRKALR
jgi:hypothetical protein